MPATNFYTLKLPNDRRSLDSTAGHEYRAIAPLLDLALAQTTGHAAYVYRYDPEGGAAWLVASSGVAPASAGSFPLEGDEKSDRSWLERHALIALDEGAWLDKRFRGFPEFQKNRFEGVISVPLVAGDGIVGIANFCQLRKGRLVPRAVSFLVGLSLPLATLLRGAELREKLERELGRLTQQLADRKLLDRAKGILQARHGWSEGQAYEYIRHVSRQNRTPMREIAVDVIGNSSTPWVRTPSARRAGASEIEENGSESDPMIATASGI